MERTELSILRSFTFNPTLQMGKLRLIHELSSMYKVTQCVEKLNLDSTLLDFCRACKSLLRYHRSVYKKI